MLSNFGLGIRKVVSKPQMSKGSVIAGVTANPM